MVLQIEPVKWRGTLAGSTVTVHRHLDGAISLTLGPLRLVQYSAAGVRIEALKLAQGRKHAEEKTGGGKARQTALPPPLVIPQSTRDYHFPTATTVTV